MHTIFDFNVLLAAAEESDSLSEDDDGGGSSDDGERPRYTFRGPSTRLADLVAAQDGSFPAFGDRDDDSTDDGDDDDNEPRYRLTELGDRLLKLRTEFGVEADEEWRGATDEDNDDESSGDGSSNDGDDKDDDGDAEHMISDEKVGGDGDFDLGGAVPDGDGDPGNSDKPDDDSDADESDSAAARNIPRVRQQQSQQNPGVITELTNTLPRGYSQTIFDRDSCLPSFDECTEPTGITFAVSGNETPIWFLQKFFDDVVMNHIVIETNRYGKLKVSIRLFSKAIFNFS